jgi:hypothetical protein
LENRNNFSGGRNGKKDGEYKWEQKDKEDLNLQQHPCQNLHLHKSMVAISERNSDTEIQDKSSVKARKWLVYLLIICLKFI